MMISMKKRQNYFNHGSLKPKKVNSVNLLHEQGSWNIHRTLLRINSSRYYSSRESGCIFHL